MLERKSFFWGFGEVIIQISNFWFQKKLSYFCSLFFLALMPKRLTSSITSVQCTLYTHKRSVIYKNCELSVYCPSERSPQRAAWTQFSIIFLFSYSLRDSMYSTVQYVCFVRITHSYLPFFRRSDKRITFITRDFHAP